MPIGPIQLAIPFCQAGLAGYSDRAMRLVARRRGCPYAVTEALLDVIMLNGGVGLRKSLDINDEDHPVAGQIMGSEPDTMSRAALILAGAGYDVIDLNFACPVKKIKNKARGGHMLLDAERGLSVLKAVREALPPHVPTTVSLRRAFDDSAESDDRFYRIIEAAWSLGYAAVRVHARTVEQKYMGRARWPFLRDLKRRYPDKTILGAGDVFTAHDAVRMLRETGVDVVWIARGAIGNPWIFRHAAALLAASDEAPLQSRARHAPSAGTPGEGGGEGPDRSSFSAQRDRASKDPHPEPLPGYQERGKMAGAPAPAAPASAPPGPPAPTATIAIEPPTIPEQRQALAEHFSIAMEIHGEALAGRRMRKMGIKYSRFHPQGDLVKKNFIDVHSLRDWTRVLDQWYAADGPGVWPHPSAANEVNGEVDAMSCDGAESA